MPDKGTHTLGAEFGLAGNPPLLSDPAYKARRKAKDARHRTNVANRAADNERRSQNR